MAGGRRDRARVWVASRAAGAALMWGLAGLRWCGWV